MVAKLSTFTLALAGLSLLSASQLAVAQPHPDNPDLHWQVVDR